MKINLSQLRQGQKAKIDDFDIDSIPLKLLEMGCLPGNEVQLLQVAPLGDPLYLLVNDAHLAIRKETADAIQVTLFDIE
ncbi:ferrous iron transport protein A [Flavobacterium columnare NBRC 100251 = ATCC 23463]|uniref:Ferrous iron transport protein A n=1 Tax=Flavobacterium columnare (strain ATCC 49512 / CIP 103533 / TG 44/87) TaxID=1041826 RepID=G8XAL0_FLACA|nr:FeoA family protein [Flavobacterium columnare]AEW86681.1 ferrous iron transport protein A [Flavobacterium columnare ATCC 49512]APT22219.1 ferrous iron transport protein A [Flavobacterium columnare]MBF6653194.1 ferrous iron transport protein A [Flavobacterium columnare]OOB82314.1 ferrous iron transport protein A [Flavobacterium columnare]PDS23361.1 ferrous iron transport protein A [Flavobacterium columnare NBRC 100251 = ATCC 23463]